MLMNLIIKNPKTIINLLLISLLICILYSCVSTTQTAPDFYDDPLSEINTAKLIEKSKNYSDENSDFVILLEKVVYRVTPKNRVIYEIHQITKILKEESAKQLSNKIIWYNSTSEFISKVDAYTIDPKGNKINATVSPPISPFYNSQNQLDLYQDIKVQIVKFDALHKGSIVNIRYQVEVDYSDIQGLVEGIFYLANRIPILKQKGIIILPKDKPIQFKQINTELKPKKITKDDLDYYIIEHDNADIITSEIYQPTFHELAPKIMFTTFQSWKELNDKLLPTLSTQIKEDKLVKEKAMELTKGIDSTQKKCEAIYNFVTNINHISNVAIPFGLNGYISYPSHEILKLKYADSKDKSILLINLLRAVGVHAKIALTNDSHNFDSEIPLLKGLNRILVAIPNGEQTIFVDPHSAIVRYGHLPSNNYGKNVIILDKKEPVITTIPNLKPNENQVTYETNSKLSPKGDLSYTTTFIPTGSYEINERASMIKLKLQNKGIDLKDSYKRIIEQSPKVKLIDFLCPDPFNIAVQYQYKVSTIIHDFPIMKDDTILVRPELHHRNLFRFAKKRKYDLNFSQPFKVVSKHKMNYPSNWDLVKLPDSVKIDTDQWKYIRTVDKKENSIYYFRELTIKKSRIDKQDYSDFKHFIEQVIQADQTMIEFSPAKKQDKRAKEKDETK